MTTSVSGNGLPVTKEPKIRRVGGTLRLHVDGVQLSVGPVAQVQRPLVLLGEFGIGTEADARGRAEADIFHRARLSTKYAGHLPVPSRQPNSPPETQ